MIRVVSMIAESLVRDESLIEHAQLFRVSSAFSMAEFVEECIIFTWRFAPRENSITLFLKLHQELERALGEDYTALVLEAMKTRLMNDEDGDNDNLIAVATFLALKE